MPVNITEEFVRFLMKQNEEQSARLQEVRGWKQSLFKYFWKVTGKTYG